METCTERRSSALIKRSIRAFSMLELLISIHNHLQCCGVPNYRRPFFCFYLHLELASIFESFYEVDYTLANTGRSPTSDLWAYSNCYGYDDRDVEQQNSKDVTCIMHDTRDTAFD
jgi:hypothetical protein